MEIINPYLAEYNKLHCRTSRRFSYGSMEAYAARPKLVREYAWAIPSDEALRRIVNFAPRICEIGAGTGYWAHMLDQYGAHVFAYDLRVPGKNENAWGHQKTWFPVVEGDVLSINRHQERALMLCWPPYDDSMAAAALKMYSGRKVIYIGEGPYGCTGNDEFHELLSKWKEVEEVDIPQWDGIHDSVTLYERN